MGAVIRSSVGVALASAALSLALWRASADDPAKKTYVFKSIDGLELKADVYRPRDPGPRPVVVWLHGGGLVQGERGWVRPDFVEFCLREGFALVSLDYRLAPETKLPGIVADIEDGLRWIRKEGPALFGADPDRIAVAGNSAGGYLALMAGLRVRPRPNVLISYWGYGSVDGAWLAKPHYTGEGYKLLSPGDLRNPEGKLKRDLYYIHLRQQGTWTQEITGLDPRTQEKEIHAYDPVRHVTKEFPPTLLLHGEDDDDVPCAESVALSEALERQHVPHALILVPGAGHELEKGKADLVQAAHRKAQDFLVRHLKEPDGR